MAPTPELVGPLKRPHEVAMIALCRRTPFCVAPCREPPDPASTAVPSVKAQRCAARLWLASDS